MNHECGTSRPVGYFLEWLIPLAPFAKKEMAITLKGITTGQGDLGVSWKDLVSRNRKTA